MLHKSVIVFPIKLHNTSSTKAGTQREPCASTHSHGSFDSTATLQLNLYPQQAAISGDPELSSYTGNLRESPFTQGKTKNLLLATLYSVRESLYVAANIILFQATVGFQCYFGYYSYCSIKWHGHSATIYPPITGTKILLD